MLIIINYIHVQIPLILIYENRCLVNKLLKKTNIITE